MIRSRFLFMLLLLAYLGLTPAGVYTCACFMPGQPLLPEQGALHNTSNQAPSGHTAVATLLAYLSLSFFMVNCLSLARQSRCCPVSLRPCRRPAEFVEPPPTPPPHFA